MGSFHCHKLLYSVAISSISFQHLLERFIKSEGGRLLKSLTGTPAAVEEREGKLGSGRRTVLLPDAIRSTGATAFAGSIRLLVSTWTQGSGRLPAASCRGPGRAWRGVAYISEAAPSSGWQAASLRRQQGVGVVK